MTEIIAILTRMEWMGLEDGNERKLISAGSFLIETLLEIEPGQRNNLQSLFLAGLQVGANAFNEAGCGIARTLEAVREGPAIESRGARILMLDFSATRSDLRRHREMTHVEMLRAAACALGGLAQYLPCSSRVLALHWNPDNSPASLPGLWLSLGRMARGGPIKFPVSEFPELARKMERWDVEASSGQPTAPSSRLRI